LLGTRATETAPAATEVAKIKGLAFIEILRWYARTHGMRRLHEAVASLPPHLRALVIDPERETLGLLSGSWYPTPLITCVFRHMTKDLSPAAVQRLAADAVEHSVGTTLTGVYRAIIRVLVSPKMVADHYQKLWRLYHTTGECKVIVHSPTHQEMRLSHWPAHDSFICLMNLYATKLILETVGCRGVSVTWDKCVDRKDPYCAYSQTWID
jgi:hypothetical protein